MQKNSAKGNKSAGTETKNCKNYEICQYTLQLDKASLFKQAYNIKQSKGSNKFIK